MFLEKSSQIFANLTYSTYITTENYSNFTMKVMLSSTLGSFSPIRLSQTEKWEKWSWGTGGYAGSPLSYWFVNKDLDKYCHVHLCHTPHRRNSFRGCHAKFWYQCNSLDLKAFLVFGYKSCISHSLRINRFKTTLTPLWQF